MSTPNPLKSLFEKIEYKEHNSSDAQLKKILEFIHQNGLIDNWNKSKNVRKRLMWFLHWSLLIVQALENEKLMREAWSQWGKIWAKDEQIKGRIKMINTSIINHTYKQYYQVTRKEMLFGSFHLILYEHSDELSDWNIITNSLNS